jgi:hypothetical protein
MAARAFKRNVGGAWSWTLDVIKVVLVDYASYTLDLAAHEFLSDIAPGARVATSSALTGKTRVNGVLDADDAQFGNVSGAQSEAVVLFQDTGDPATSRLLYVLDSTAPATPGLPVSPNGGPIVVTWDNGPNKIVNMDYQA